MGLQVRDDLEGLPAGEGAFVLADHHGVEAAVRPGRIAEQFRGLRPLMPGKATRGAGVEVLGHDHPVPGDQVGGVVVLPLP